MKAEKSGATNTPFEHSDSSTALLLYNAPDLTSVFKFGSPISDNILLTKYLWKEVRWGNTSKQSRDQKGCKQTYNVNRTHLEEEMKANG